VRHPRRRAPVLLTGGQAVRQPQQPFDLAPPSEKSRPPSNRATTALPCTGERPGRNGVTSTAGAIVRGFTLDRIDILCYTRPPSVDVGGRKRGRRLIWLLSTGWCRMTKVRRGASSV
jgi:hypothetical protein